MIPPDQIHRDLTDTARDLERLGASTWARFDAWEKNPQMARDSLRGGGVGEGKTTDQIEDARLDRQAAGYQSELSAITHRLAADSARLRVLMRIANPDAPRQLRLGDMTAAQLIADGWCPSCFRDNHNLSPLAAGRYADRCRGCGETRAREGRDPNLDELRIMHARGKSLRQRVVESIRSA